MYLQQNTDYSTVTHMCLLISDSSPMYFSILMVCMVSPTELWLPSERGTWNHCLMVLIEMLALCGQNVLSVFNDARYNTEQWQ